jgi:hypothetical protein
LSYVGGLNCKGTGSKADWIIPDANVCDKIKKTRLQPENRYHT